MTKQKTRSSIWFVVALITCIAAVVAGVIWEKVNQSQLYDSTRIPLISDARAGDRFYYPRTRMVTITNKNGVDENDKHYEHGSTCLLTPNTRTKYMHEAAGGVILLVRKDVGGAPVGFPHDTVLCPRNAQFFANYRELAAINGYTHQLQEQFDL